MANNKKILHFHTDGVMAAIFVLPLIEFERRQGYESRIITSINPLTVANGLVAPFDLNIRNLFLFPFTFVKICHYISKYNPDIIFSHNFKSALLPLLAARFVGVPIRIYFNHGVPYIGYAGIFRKLMMWIELTNLRLATEVITVSKGMKKILHSLSPQKKITLIGPGSACGVDLVRFRSNQSARLDPFFEDVVRESICNVVFIGRPEIRKGFLVILEFWVKYFQANKSFKLFLCGPTIEHVINFLDYVPDNIKCFGFTSKVPEILSMSDYLIMPSLHEGLSYAIIEAMASECIVIANDIDGVNNLIKDGINGFLVKNNSIDEYAKKIISIEHESPSVRNKIKKAGLKTSEQYSRYIFMDNYKVYLQQFE